MHKIDKIIKLFCMILTVAKRFKKSADATCIFSYNSARFGKAAFFYYKIEQENYTSADCRKPLVNIKMGCLVLLGSGAVSLRSALWLSLIHRFCENYTVQRQTVILFDTSNTQRKDGSLYGIYEKAPI